MPNPKRRHSKSRTRQRRAHDALKLPQYYIDKDSGEPKMPHRIDPETGTYKGRQIIEVKESE
ncbi:MAG TPA: 50S ribosomal protein L32 [Pyrinomonadaceae bacterium]|jgi:large subunit ribosomal protein L32